MTTDIQVATLVGQAWEELVGDAIAGLPGSYERSPELGPGIIRPDYIRSDRRAAICVTATTSTQTFIKKRWRYTNEVFQLKSLFGPDLTCVNVFAADPEILRGGGASVLELLFDASINLSLNDAFAAIHAELVDSFKNGERAATVLAKLRRRAEVKSLITATTEELAKCVSAPSPDRVPLWKVVTNGKNRQIKAVVAPTLPTYFRRTCLRLVPLKASERGELLAAAVSRKAIKVDPATLALCGIETSQAIGGSFRLSDSEIIATLSNGFSMQDVTYACDAISSLAQAKGFPVQEITDANAVSRRVRDLRCHLAKPRALAEELERQFRDETLSRVWAIEYLTAWRGLSMLRINRDYVRDNGKIGVTNPIDNITLKTDMSSSLVRDRRASGLWEKLGTLLLNNWTANDKSDEELVNLVRQYRLKSLLLQPYLNPTRSLFEKICDELGLTVRSASVDCLLNDLGLGGRGSRVEELYEIQIGSTTTYIKVLSGYKGGYEHKADEMGARSWLLRYRKTGEAFTRSGVRLIFVYEGEWSQEYLDMLLASGWSDLLSLSAFRATAHSVLGIPSGRS
jgi:hypothetical protein